MARDNWGPPPPPPPPPQSGGHGPSARGGGPASHGRGRGRGRGGKFSSSFTMGRSPDSLPPPPSASSADKEEYYNKRGYSPTSPHRPRKRRFSNSNGDGRTGGDDYYNSRRPASTDRSSWNDKSEGQERRGHKPDYGHRNDHKSENKDYRPGKDFKRDYHNRHDQDYDYKKSNDRYDKGDYRPKSQDNRHKNKEDGYEKRRNPLPPPPPTNGGPDHRSNLKQKNNKKRKKNNNNNNQSANRQAPYKKHQGEHPPKSTPASLPQPPQRDAREKTPPVEPSMITYRNGSIWKRELQVGEGTYGRVYKARNVETGKMAALKRLRLESERDGVPITAVREVRLLQALRHPAIVSLREMMVEQGNIYMAFEYMDHDLAGILAHPELKLTDGNCKYLFRQMVDGLAYLHHRGVLHRDIKGSNILIDNKGKVKIADFGLARTVDLSNPHAHYTNRVITLWYRPPELLLGATVYSGGVDVWGLGCILVELFTKRAVFQAQDEIAQLESIFNVLGTPDETTWPDIKSLPWYRLLMPPTADAAKRNRFSELYSKIIPTENCLSLATKMLRINPRERISAEDALAHEYFNEEPSAEPLDLSNIGEWHDFEAKKRRRRARQQQQQDQENRQEQK